jgi:hypothetical protein
LKPIVLTTGVDVFVPSLFEEDVLLLLEGEAEVPVVADGVVVALVVE